MVLAKLINPFDSTNVDLEIYCDHPSPISLLAISGFSANFPVIWDSFGGYDGSPVLDNTSGVDTSVVIVQFSNFSRGQTVHFKQIDADFVGLKSSRVRNRDLVGSRLLVEFEDGSRRISEFQINYQYDIIYAYFE